MTHFLWGGSTARFALRTCMWSTYCGGIAAADIQSYHAAAHLQILNEWWYGSREGPAFQVEQWLMGDPSAHFIYSRSEPKDLLPATKVVIITWRQVLRRMGWWGCLPQETPLWRNRLLPQVADLQGFLGWA